MELTIEIVPQVTVLCLMILLKNSETNLETGLQGVFESDPILGIPVNTFLILNILWSLRSGVFTSLKVKKESKGFIPSKGSVLLLLKNSLSLTTRITCIVMFFTPYLGCLNLATHWKSEQIKLHRLPDQFPDNKFTFYFDGNVHNEDWRDIYRSNVQDVHIEDYTLFKLGVAYALFWGIMALQIMSITVLKGSVQVFCRQVRGAIQKKMSQIMEIAVI